MVASFKAVSIQAQGGWSQSVLQWYYARILSMDPLPWATSVMDKYGKAQFMHGAGTSSSPQPCPELPGRPMIPKARPSQASQAKQEKGAQYYYSQLDQMDPHGRCSAMMEKVENAQMNCDYEDLIPEIDEMKNCLELMTKAQKLQDETEARLQEDLFRMKEESLATQKDMANLKTVISSVEMEAEEIQIRKETEEAEAAQMLQEFIAQKGITMSSAIKILKGCANSNSERYLSMRQKENPTPSRKRQRSQ